MHSPYSFIDDYIQAGYTALGYCVKFLLFLLVIFFIYKSFRALLGLKIRRRVDRVPGTRCSLRFCTYDVLFEEYEKWREDRKRGVG